jgi:hypothetical protein
VEPGLLEVGMDTPGGDPDGLSNGASRSVGRPMITWKLATLKPAT